MRYYIQKNKFYEVDGALGEGYDLSVDNTLEDLQAGKVIELNEQQKAFALSNPFASAIEIYLCALNTMPEPTIEQLRAALISRIDMYDHSPAVNSFTLNGNKMWLDRNERVSLMQTATIMESSGETTIKLWTEGVNPISIDV